jgi:hypothetical protein
MLAFVFLLIKNGEGRRPSLQPVRRYDAGDWRKKAGQMLLAGFGVEANAFVH